MTFNFQVFADSNISTNLKSLFAALSSALHFKLSSCGPSEVVAVAWKCFGKDVCIVVYLLYLYAYFIY